MIFIQAFCDWWHFVKCYEFCVFVFLCTESMVLESTPIRSKLSNRLSSFKSNFSQQKISDADGNFLLTNAAAKRPFIPVSSASNRGKAFVGNNKLSSKINSPSIDFKKNLKITRSRMIARTICWMKIRFFVRSLPKLNCRSRFNRVAAQAVAYPWNHSLW